MGPEGRKKPRDGEIQGKPGRTAPGPYKRRKNNQAPEVPIQDTQYAKKPDTSHFAAKKFLDEFIRKYGTSGEVVSSAPWKVGH